ncbi:MAG: MarR family transcriptional regulator [marine bacterium B5-7]|nr:MAG: MarR family transcriptional regulator [marine bacterium B5-7]
MDSIEDVLIALRRVIRATDLHSRQLIKTTGITTPQLLLLQSVNNKNEVTVSELAKDISLSQATVTNILVRLEKRGLLLRTRSLQDKRKVHISITEDGLRAIQDAPIPLQENFTNEFRKLKNWEQGQIISSLQRVAEMMDAEGISASPVLDVGELDRQTESQEVR